MIMLCLLALMVLATLISGLHVWLSEHPAWAVFKASLAGLLCVLALTVLVLGKEFHWWQIDGELLDKLAVFWIALTIGVMGITYWLVR